MDFTLSPNALEWRERATTFLHEVVLPAEGRYAEEVEALAADGSWSRPPVMAELKTEARDRSLWNLFLPGTEHGAGLSTSDYAPTAEVSGWSPWLMPEAMNCSAPDTGNMELLAMFATPGQSDRWLAPLLAGDVRSCFSMTEPQVASSDARNIATSVEIGQDEIVVSGTKWWSTGAMAPECEFSIVLGRSDPSAEPHRQHSMVVVPLDARGVTVERSTTVLGYADRAHGGHAVVRFDDVRVPRDHLLGEPGGGFAMAQARLGPGRVHHCMRLLGSAERAVAELVRRGEERIAFGRPLVEHGPVQDAIARGRLALDQARLLVLRTAWEIDTYGAKEAAAGIAAIKAVVPSVACQVIDDAMQVHGGMGMSSDSPLASLYAAARSLRIADGPDEVHRRSVARAERRRQRDLPQP